MKQCLVTKYLASIGLLDAADPIAISEAKKSFWADRRNKCRAARRARQKSIQIFIGQTTYKAISQKAKQKRLSRSAFVKEATMHALISDETLYREQLFELRTLTFTILRLFEGMQATTEDSSVHLINFQRALTQLLKTLTTDDH